MKRLLWFAVIPLSASISSTALAAQSFGVSAMEDPSGHAQSTSAPQQPESGCPVSMHASQIGGGTTAMVDSSAQKHPVARGLHLSLADPQHAATIVSAEVTIHGLNGKPHAVQSGQLRRFDGVGSRNPWEMTRKLTVQFGPTNDHSAEIELSVAGFSAVSWIRLDSLTFSDGTVWVPASAVACRTAPDPFMLVSAK